MQDTTKGTTPSRAVLVVGAGDATGGAIARRFAREGYVACVVRREASHLATLVDDIASAGGQARAFGVDAREEEQVVAMFDAIESEVAPLEAVVYNIGANVRIWTPPRFASIPFFGHEVRLLTYIRPVVDSIGLPMLGHDGLFARQFPLLFRASRIWTFAGSTGAGSTCLPSFGLLAIVN